VGFAVKHTVALQNGGATDGLCEMALPRSWWSKQEHVLPLQQEAGRRQLVDQIPLSLELMKRIIRSTHGTARAEAIGANLALPAFTPQAAGRLERGY